MIRSKRYAFVAALMLMTGACEKKVDAKDVFVNKSAAQLAKAAATGDTAKIDKLIKAGADQNAIGYKGISVLQFAMLNQNKEGFQALLAHGADVRHADDTGNTVMLYAAMANDAGYMELLLARRVDPNGANAITGETPLMRALFGGRKAQFRDLLAVGAKGSLADHFGNTSLHVAAQINDFQSTLDLLKAGADPSLRNQQNATFQAYLNMTPTKILSKEARVQREGVLNWLVEHRVPIETRPSGR